jgi:hypothetical protein
LYLFERERMVWGDGVDGDEMGRGKGRDIRYGSGIGRGAIVVGWGLEDKVVRI